MSVCGKCGHANAAGKDFCSECGDFLGWNDDPPAPVTQPVRAAPVAPSRSAAAASDPAILQAEDEAQAAGEEAARVRAEADQRARAATETAKRQATEEARGAREAAYSRAEQVVEVAARTAGGNRAEVAALVAQVREEAESKARAEVDDAELRAARRARRAREEAHAQARAEAAEADRKAKEAAERASAMIARPPVKPTAAVRVPATAQVPPVVLTRADGGPVARAPEAPAGGAAVRPVLPGAPQWRPPAVDAAEASEPTNPNDIVCRRCGTGSEPSRRFCRKCGESLLVVPEAPRLSWVGRLRRWFRATSHRLPAERGEAPQPAAAQSSGPGLSLAGLARGALAVGAAVGLIAVLGPYRHQASADVTDVRRRVIPRPSYIDAEMASAGPNRTRIPELTDKLLSPREFTSTEITTSNPPAPGNPPAFSVALGKDADLTKPVNVFKVGVIAGVLGEQPAKHPSVHHLLAVAYGKDGHQEKAKTLTLRDDSSFQSFLFVVNHVLRVDFYVLDTYDSPDRQGPYAIDEVEFFALT